MVAKARTAIDRAQRAHEQHCGWRTKADRALDELRVCGLALTALEDRRASLSLERTRHALDVLDAERELDRELRS